jgi:hypothetical protein
MNTTTNTAVASVNASEKMVTLKICDSTGDTELLLTVTKAAERALDEIKKAGRWLFTTSASKPDLDQHFVDVDSPNALTELIGIFTVADEAMLTGNLVGGFDDLDDEDSDEDFEDFFADEDTDDVIGSVKLVYVDDVNGKSQVLNQLSKQPQLVVSISENEDGEEIATVYVRNTELAREKLVSQAPFILAALGKIHSNEA